MLKYYKAFVQRYLILLALLVLIFAQEVSGTNAEIYGTVYSFYLEKLDKAIVTINTTPIQKIVTVNGSYRFLVPLGNYELCAKYYSDGELFIDRQNISITSEGRFVFDLILFPSFEEEEDILKEAEFDVTEPYFEEAEVPLFFFIVGIIAALFVAFLTYKMFKKRGVKLDPELKELYNHIKQKGRTTQKEIRKAFSRYSEAKISLMLAELESKKLIRKIKKGRGNIIILP